VNNQAHSPVWQLPARIDELLPGQAELLERARRRLLDLYFSWGYELILPPLIEQVDSLLAGMSDDLDRDTFRFTDAYTGYQLAIRSDITPQAARIDAHYLRRYTPTRLCYAGQVARVYPSDINHSRNPFQVGAEVFGQAELSADLEVVQLALASLQSLDFRALVLDLGHVGVLDSVFNQLGLQPAQRAQLIDLYQRKALPELDSWIAQQGFAAPSAQVLRQLPRLTGNAQVLDQVANLLKDFDKASTCLQQIVDLIQALSLTETVQLNLDFTELRGHQYHTGLVFSLYDAQSSVVLIQGGRYDDVGAAFGYQRPATGFTLDLKLILKNLTPPKSKKLLVPCLFELDQAMRQQIDQWRREGYLVVYASGQPSRDLAHQLNCEAFYQIEQGALALVTL
jgi:ATP phosphoribosyltransferase regulatory subunit